MKAKLDFPECWAGGPDSQISWAQALENISAPNENLRMCSEKAPA